jgi:hypothetical protein
MVTTREIKGTKEQIAEQIGRMSGRIVSAIVVVDESAGSSESKQTFVPPTDEEFAKLMDELRALAVSAPNVDYSREAMYTRMPGE